MYKLVIIDDEPLIREGLKSVVERLCANWVVAGTADSAESGLECIRRENPDAAIVDVRMDGLSGLQMIEMANADQLETEFIVLSGYNDFQYVQQALRLRVYDYLLKPVNRSELVRLLSGLEAKRRGDESGKRKETADIFSAASKTYLLEQTLHQLIRGHLHLDRRQKAVLDEFQIDFDRQNFMMYRMEMLPDSLKNRIRSPKDKELFLLFCKQVIDEHVKKDGGKNFMFLDAESVPIVLLVGDSKEELLGRKKFEMIENIRLVIRNYGKIDLLIGSSNVFTGAAYVQVAYGQTKESARAGWLDDPVRKAIDYISRNFAEDIGLRTVAEKVHLNPNYFSDLFHKRTGIRFVEYVNFVRLEEAARLLRETKLPVQEIIERVGYHNYRQFNRVFHHQFRMTPTEYRKKYWQ